MKGICCGVGSLLIAIIRGEQRPELRYISFALVLGYVAYGLSIFLYVRAQRTLGAAKTSAYYAVALFIGAFLSYLFLHEKLTGMYLLSLAIMISGTALVVADTTIRNHTHVHQHTFVHTHDGSTHRHTISHTHIHNHLLFEESHIHHHTRHELKHALKSS